MFSLVTKYSLLFINKIIRDASNISMPSASGTPLLKPRYFLGQSLCHKKEIAGKNAEERKRSVHIISVLAKSVMGYAIMPIIYANNICKTRCKIVFSVYSDSPLIHIHFIYTMIYATIQNYQRSMQWYKEISCLLNDFQAKVYMKVPKDEAIFLWKDHDNWDRYFYWLEVSGKLPPSSTCYICTLCLWLWCSSVKCLKT